MTMYGDKRPRPNSNKFSRHITRECLERKQIELVMKMWNLNVCGCMCPSRWGPSIAVILKALCARRALTGMSSLCWRHSKICFDFWEWASKSVTSISLTNSSSIFLNFEAGVWLQFLFQEKIFSFPSPMSYTGFDCVHLWGHKDRLYSVLVLTLILYWQLPIPWPNL